MKTLLDRLGKGEGLWLLAFSGLGSVVGLRVGGQLSGAEFVSSFSVWLGAVFSSAAVAGFRDWRKNGNGGGGAP